MYDLGPALDGRQVAPGTNILLTGPPLAGKSDLGFDVLEAGVPSDDGTIVVSTRDAAERVLAERRALFEYDPVAVVDGATEHQGLSTADADRVRYVASPEDMTGIGIEFTGLLEELHGEVERIRVLFSSVTPLLLYADLGTAFRFLHVFCNRVESADALGLYVLQRAVHDEQALHTLRQLFDGTVEVDGSGITDVRLPSPAD